MTAKPYEVLIRFGAEGSPAGASIRTVTTVDGKDYVSDPAPLSTDSTDFADFAETFAADALIAKDAAIAERDAVQAKLDSAMTRIADLTTWEPRKIDPSAWYARFTRDEIIAIAKLNATDQNVQSILKNMDDSIALRKDDPTYQMSLDHPNAIQGTGYLQSVGILSAERVAELLSDSREDEQ